jgi:hypothetical protein
MNYIQGRPEANIFHHPLWIGFLAKTYGFKPFISVVENSAGQITAGLPVMEVNSLFIKKKWVSLPFTDHCAPLFSDQESLKILIEGIVDSAESLNTVNVEFRWDIQTPGLFQIADNVLSTSNLDENSKDIFFSNPTKMRNFVKAVKRGVVVEKGTSLHDLREFYKLHLESRKRQGVPIQPWRFFENLKEMVLDEGLGQIWLARMGREYVSGVIYLYWNQTITYKLAATSIKGRQLFAGDYLIYEAIKWGCERGYKTLDWGKSEQANTGLRQYKRHWGAAEIPLTYLTNYQNRSNGMKNKLFPLLKKVINKSPLWVCKFSGEILYKYFGV